MALEIQTQGDFKKTPRTGRRRIVKPSAASASFLCINISPATWHYDLRLSSNNGVLRS